MKMDGEKVRGGDCEMVNGVGYVCDMVEIWRVETDRGLYGQDVILEG